MSSGLPLDTLASTVKAELKKSDQMLIAAGQHLIEARARVGKGEAGDDVDWKRWLAIHQIGEEKAKVCLRIANDPNPEQALIVHREKARATDQAYRDRKATVGSRPIPDQSAPVPITHTPSTPKDDHPHEPTKSLVRELTGDPWIERILALLATGTPAQLDYVRDWLAS